MEHPIIQIKNAITALLKGIDPGTDVFYEEIKGTEEKYGLNEPETYYFVDIIPNGNQTVDRFFTDMGVLVKCILAHNANVLGCHTFRRIIHVFFAQCLDIWFHGDHPPFRGL